MPAISVIMPVYNAEKWLDRAVDSLRAQTFGDLQILLVDDGSTDTSPELCDAHAAADKRVQVIHKPNGGQSQARNVGLAAAKGDYITFMDDDDYLLPYMYERMYGVATAEGARVVKCGMYFIPNEEFVPPYPVDEQALKGRWGTYSFKDGVISDKEFLRNMVTGQRDGAVWNLLIEGEIGRQLRFPEKTYYEDGQVNLDLLDRVDSFHLLPDCMYLHLTRGDSRLASVTATDRLDLAHYNMRLFEYSGRYGMYDCQWFSYQMTLKVAQTIDTGQLEKTQQVLQRMRQLVDFLKTNADFEPPVG